jgi:hypothetical protein
MLAEMGGPRREQPNRYRVFVERGLAEADDDFRAALKESPRSMGVPRFGGGWTDFIRKSSRLTADRRTLPFNALRSQ